MQTNAFVSFLETNSKNVYSAYTGSHETKTLSSSLFSYAEHICISIYIYIANVYR